jgi:hypothetical protein
MIIIKVKRLSLAVGLIQVKVSDYRQIVFILDHSSFAFLPKSFLPGEFAFSFFLLIAEAG